jgi:hypothetical protein
MLGIAEQARRRRELHDAPQVHDADAVGDVMDDREVVRDEEICEPESALQVAHQVQHLRLHRNVERGSRLVAHEELGIGRERARRDALACPPELVRVLDAILGRQSDLLQSLSTLGDLVGRQRLVLREGSSATMAATRQRGFRLA